MSLHLDLGQSFCCYCEADGTGRIIFMNSKNDIVDNAFCTNHLQIVCKHTVRKLKKRMRANNPASIADPRFLIEGYYEGYHRRQYLPSTAQFNRRYERNSLKYETMAALYDFNYAE